jgi:hypothetical protein
MRRRRRATIEDLRLAIDAMPRHTKIAMLEGIRTNDIIVGAYTWDGGICPMLAAHRAGGRTSLISFAKAWDRFASRESRSLAARRATERELRILTSQLEASVVSPEVGAPDLSAAVSEHRRLLARRRAAPEPSSRSQTTAVAQTRTVAETPTVVARPGDPDPSSRLRSRPGWAWMRIVRRYDDYERMLERLEAERSSLVAAREPERVG